MPPDRRQCHRWSGLNKQIKHGWPSFLIQLPIYTVHRGYRYIHYLYRYYTEDRETWSRKPRGCNQQNPDHGKLQDKQPGLSNTSNEVVRRKREKKEERKEREDGERTTDWNTHTQKTHQPITRCGLYAAPNSGELLNDNRICDTYETTGNLDTDWMLGVTELLLVLF